MDDWGSNGPILGPYQFVHTTYGWDIKLGKSNGNCDELYVRKDMVYYDLVYYGDWSVFDEGTCKEAQFQITQFEQAKANMPSGAIAHITGG
jgi:hypothetical protein